MSVGTRRRDVASFIGLPLSIAVLVGAQWLEGGSLWTLVQPSAALVVFGGTLAAVLLSFPMRSVRAAFRASLEAFERPAEPDQQLVMRLADYGQLARRRGAGALESVVGNVADPFLKRGLELTADGFGAAHVRRTLETESRTREQQDEEPADVLESAAGYAPTVGILGAVLGLIHVMENLAVPSKLGSGIAVAFVATVYGVGAANLLFLPLATKIRGRARAHAAGRELVVEAISAIQQEMHPRLLEQQLRAFLRRQRDARGREIAA